MPSSPQHASPKRHVASTQEPVVPEAQLSGMHDVEADFAERGVWVERRLRLPLPAGTVSKVVLSGLFFPKLISAQGGDGSVALRFLVGHREVHAATLKTHGSFEIAFDTGAGRVDEGQHLSILSDRCFVPAQIGEGDDERELCWRLCTLNVGDVRLFDCSRPFNFFLGSVAHGASDLTPEDCRPVGAGPRPLRFHLDSPVTGTNSDRADAFRVSGWAFDPRARASGRVRVVVGERVYQARPSDRPDVRSAFDMEETLPVATGFTTLVSGVRGVLPIRIEVLDSSGAWFARRRGVVVAAPPSAAFTPVRQGDLWSRVLPQALRSRLQDHLRARRSDGPDLQLPASFRFHLDHPRIDRLNVVGADCVVSGWAFDEEGPTTLEVRAVVGTRIFAAEARQRGDVQKAFEHLGAMPLHSGFACVLKLPVGIHTIRIDLECGVGNWVPVRRARVLRLPELLRDDAAAAELTFRGYAKARRRYLEQELPEIRRHIGLMIFKPMFMVFIQAGPGGSALERTWRSVKDQIYPCFTVQVLKDGIAPDDMTGRSPLAESSDFVVLLRAGQTLSRHALYAFASIANEDPEADVVYGDETTVPAEGGEPSPFYKPEWSPDYLETFNYLGAACCFRTKLVAACIDDLVALHPYDLALRVTERTRQVRHISDMLGHDSLRRDDGRPIGGEQATVAERQALAARLQRTGRQGVVSEHAVHKGCYSIALKPIDKPLVSVVIPTAGKTIVLGTRTIDLITNIVEQIVNRSSYKNVEIVIVDNGDLSPGQIAALDRAGCRCVTYEDPVFNISKKLNLGVTLARGEFLLLMNDDIEVLDERWIDRMLDHFQKPHVGVVGVRLLYPDGKLQHVGVAHNSGNPDHVRRFFSADDPGYFFSTCGVRNYSAVTGACMMASAAVYRQVGGYSEELAVSYNDTDFCLKVSELGLSIVYAGEVTLTHMESQSRVASADMKEVAWYQRRWASRVIRDPFYNEQFLAVAPPTFVPCVNERLV